MNGTTVAQQRGPDLDTEHNNSEQYHSGPANRARPVHSMTIVKGTIEALHIWPDLNTEHDNSEQYHKGPAVRARPVHTMTTVNSTIVPSMICPRVCQQPMQSPG